MKWIDATEQLPDDQQEVLIKVSGQVNLARYHEPTKSFMLRNGNTVSTSGNKIEWLELIAPYKQ